MPSESLLLARLRQVRDPRTSLFISSLAAICESESTAVSGSVELVRTNIDSGLYVATRSGEAARTAKVEKRPMPSPGFSSWPSPVSERIAGFTRRL